MHGNLIVCNQPEDIAERAIAEWRTAAAAALRERTEFTAALSGGQTPAIFYRRLAETGADLPWEQTQIFLVDERFVPPDHRDSNFRMIRETLIDRIVIPGRNVHPIPGGRESVQEAADLYDQEIRNHFHLSESFPVFDLIVLGIGQDGHTASLFPGHPALLERGRVAAPVLLPDREMHDRITLTLPVLNCAKRIIFLLTGEKKASILKQIFSKEDYSLPAAMVNPDDGNLLFLADAAAGSEVHN